MVESGIDDLAALDRDVARAVDQIERWREDLRRDPEDRRTHDPFENVRRVSAKSTRDALGDFTPSAADIPWRDALMQWVAVLLQARLGLADDLERARATVAPRGPFNGTPARLVSWREAWRGIVAARTTGEAGRWLDAACEAGSSLPALGRKSATRRVEIARRMGFAHPWEITVPVSHAVLRSSAVRLLDVTEDLSIAVRREMGPDAAAVAATLHHATAREAGDGWPARLSTRWLEEMFGALASGMPIRLPPLAPALGASSFARALYDFGFAVRIGATPSTLAFALARDPASVAAHRHGFVFGSLPSDLEFQRQELGLGRRVAAAQARLLARTALLDVRIQASRILLGDDSAPAPTDQYDEIGVRLFGVRLDRRLRGAWPFARDDEPGRLVALLQAPSLRDTLRNRFDVDWFRNPAAWAHLRAQGAAPAREPVDGSALGSLAESLGRAFEEALG